MRALLLCRTQFPINDGFPINDDSVSVASSGETNWCGPENVHVEQRRCLTQFRCFICAGRRTCAAFTTRGTAHAQIHAPTGNAHARRHRRTHVRAQEAC
eukprot:1079538-Pleurochrysis_carterae.AAC.1